MKKIIGNIIGTILYGLIIAIIFVVFSPFLIGQIIKFELRKRRSKMKWDWRKTRIKLGRSLLRPLLLILWISAQIDNVFIKWK